MNKRLATVLVTAILPTAAASAAAAQADDAHAPTFVQSALSARAGALTSALELPPRWRGLGAPARVLGPGVPGGTFKPAGQGQAIGQLPRVLVGSLPQEAAFDPATRTVYVANQGDNTVSVVDASHCNARDTSGCGQTPLTVAVGAGPFSIAIDHLTHTVYVANQNDNTVSVINESTCNARNKSGCGQKPLAVAAGATPFGIAVDPATDTVYVADGGGPGDTVSVINGATCNATDTSGCGQTPATVTVGQFPFEVLVDPQNRSVYVTNAGENTVSMIDERTCNATNTTGCRRTSPTVAVDSFPLPLALDTRTGTLYVGSQADPVVDVINANTCNALRTTGCAGPHPALNVAGGTDGMSIDERTDTLFVSNNGPGDSTLRGDSVSVINAATCNARTAVGCRQHAPMTLTGDNPGGNATDASTDTEYVTTFDNTLQVINGATCNRAVITGCGQSAPATLVGPDPVSIAINPATSTAYVGNPNGEGFPFTLSLVDLAHCNPGRGARCRPDPAIIPMEFASWGLAVDKATDTIYATDSFDANGNAGDAVSVINGAACNATVTSGCGTVAPTVTVGNTPFAVAVDHATHTIYVVNAGDDTLSVIDGSTCNATNTSGCGHTVATVPVADNSRYFSSSLAIDQATDTVYTLNEGSPGTVAALNGATCNASVTTGCGQQPPAVTVGNDIGVGGLTVDEHTDTIYADNTADETVSVIDGATCNASNTSGCGQRPARVAVGRQPWGFVGVDQSTDLVFVTDGLDDTVSVIDGTTCNRSDTAGCGHTPPAVPAGGGPAGIAVVQSDHAVYAADSGGATASFFRFQIPRAPTRVRASIYRGQAEVLWQAPADGGLPVIYHVIPTPACPACTGLTTPPTSGAPYTTINGLTPGRSYTFAVKATDAAGTGPSSAPSNAVTP